MKKTLTTFIATLTLASCGSTKTQALKTHEKVSSLKSDQYFYSKLIATDSSKKVASYQNMDFETFYSQHLKHYLDYYIKDYGETEYGTNPHYTEVKTLLKNYKFYNKDLNKIYKFMVSSYSTSIKKAPNKLGGFTKDEIQIIREMIASYLIGKGNISYTKPFLKPLNDNLFKKFGKNNKEFASLENIKKHLEGLDTKELLAPQNQPSGSHLDFDRKSTPNYKTLNYDMFFKLHLKPYLSAFYENYEQTKGFKDLESLLKNHKFYKKDPNKLIYDPKRTDINELLHMTLSYITRVSFEEDNNNIQWSRSWWDWKEGMYYWYQEYFDQKEKLSEKDEKIKKILRSTYWYFTDPYDSNRKTLNDIKNYLTKIDR